MIDNHTSCIKVSDTKICPFCYSKKIIKNGRTKTEKQQFLCKNCKKRFLDYYSYNAYHQNINSQIIIFAKEGLGIRSIARILKISCTTLIKRIVEIANKIERPSLSYGKSYEMDELRFFSRNKRNLMWLAYAIDKKTKEVANFYIGKRNNNTLNAVIKTLTNSHAKAIYTDGFKNYTFIIAHKLHKVIRYGTNAIERKNLDIRTHLKRFHRRTIGFSKSIIVTSSIVKIYFWS